MSGDESRLEEDADAESLTNISTTESSLLGILRASTPQSKTLIAQEEEVYPAQMTDAGATVSVAEAAANTAAAPTPAISPASLKPNSAPNRRQKTKNQTLDSKPDG